MPFTDDLVTRLRMRTDDYDKGVDDAGKKASSFGRLWEGVTSRFVITAGDMFRAARAIGSGLVEMIERGGKVGDVMANTSINIRAASAAVQGLVSDFDLASRANRAVEAGINLTTEQFNALSKAAALMSQRTGVDMAQAFDGALQSVIAASSRGLKPFGISLDEVSSKLSAEDKLLAQRAQAIDLFVEKYGDATVATDDAGESLDRLRVQWTNMTDAMAVSIANSQDFIVGIDLASQALMNIRESAGWVVGAIQKVGEVFASYSILMTEGVGAALAAQRANNVYGAELDKTRDRQAKAEAAAKGLAESLAGDGEGGGRKTVSGGFDKAAEAAKKAREEHDKWIESVRSAATGKVETWIAREESRLGGMSIEEEEEQAASQAEAHADRIADLREARLEREKQQRQEKIDGLKAEREALLANTKAQIGSAMAAGFAAAIADRSAAGFARGFAGVARGQAAMAFAAAATMAVPIPGMFDPPGIPLALAAGAAWLAAGEILAALGGGGRRASASPSFTMPSGGGSFTTFGGGGGERRGSPRPIIINIEAPPGGVETGRTMRRYLNEAADEDGRPRF